MGWTHAARLARKTLASRSWSVSWTVKVFPFIWPLEVADGSGSHPLHAGASFSILPGQACLEKIRVSRRIGNVNLRV